MSRKLVKEWKLVTNGDMSGNITSDAYNIINVDNVGIQLSWAGTPTGTFTVEASNDAIVWTKLEFDPTDPIAIGSASNALININQIPYAWLHLVYTADSSTGVLNATITTKTIGA